MARLKLNIGGNDGNKGEFQYISPRKIPHRLYGNDVYFCVQLCYKKNYTENDDFSFVIRSLSALAFLPPEHVVEGFEQLCDEFEEEGLNISNALVENELLKVYLPDTVINYSTLKEHIQVGENKEGDEEVDHNLISRLEHVRKSSSRFSQN